MSHAKGSLQRYGTKLIIEIWWARIQNESVSLGVAKRGAPSFCSRCATNSGLSTGLPVKVPCCKARVAAVLRLRVIQRSLSAAAGRFLSSYHISPSPKFPKFPKFPRSSPGFPVSGFPEISRFTICVDSRYWLIIELFGRPSGERKPYSIGFDYSTNGESAFNYYPVYIIMLIDSNTQ